MPSSFRRNPAILIIAAALVISLSMGIRSTFGLFQGPMTMELGFGRESFAFAMAIQQLLWGLFQPVCGMVADRYGSGRVLIAGALAYSAGLYVMSGVETTLGLNIGAGWMIGFGMAATSFSVVLGALGRLVPPERQTTAFGIASAGGSLGQFIMAPIGQQVIQSQSWSGALVILAILACAIMLSATVLQSKASDASLDVAGSVGAAQQTMRTAIIEATTNRNYRLLTMGFFVCGFQVSFMTMHLPAYLQDAGMTATTGAIALALIGFFNIIGTYTCGVLGGRFPKKYLLSLLYFFRSVFVMLFLIFPISEVSVYLFSSAMGLLWLGTVPLTSGIVAQIFGPKYMSTLFGIVFLGHQLGSFIGVWLGGYLYDTTGSYDGIWYGSVALGIAAALLHLPIVERPLHRTAAAA
jgi:MFS family permease